VKEWVRLRLAALASVCVLGYVLVVGPGSAAGATEFGEVGQYIPGSRISVCVAVDNNALSSSYNDVYVADSSNARIGKFHRFGRSPAGLGLGRE